MCKKDIKEAILGLEAFEIVDIIEKQSIKKLKDLKRISTIRLQSSKEKKDSPLIFKGE